MKLSYTQDVRGVDYCHMRNLIKLGIKLKGNVFILDYIRTFNNFNQTDACQNHGESVYSNKEMQYFHKFKKANLEH